MVISKKNANFTVQFIKSQTNKLTEMEVQQIPIGRVKPSPMNPRKTFDEGGLQELADNIMQQGLLQPITVRPLKSTGTDPFADCEYEIVCGERRYRALLIIAQGKDDYKVPCIVRNLTDDEAFDAMITENLQRLDVDPIEEAFAFSQLVKRGDTTEEIALRFGKSQRFVTDRIKLNNLIPELLMKVKDGAMAISAGMIISKLDDELQRKFIERYGNYQSNITKELAVRYCNEIFQYIGNSAWAQDDRDDFDGGCGVRCADCPFNTINVGCLFYEMKAETSTARCTSKSKFLDKKLAYMMSLIDAHADDIIKAGDPLEFGKIAIVSDIASYCRDRAEAEKFIEQVKAKGYEVFKRDDVFATYSHYDPDDERVQAKLANHEVYRCLNIQSYYQGVDVEERYYELKKNMEGVDNATIVEGVTAANLAQKYEDITRKCLQDRASVLCALFRFNKDAIRNDDLTEEEMDAIVAYMLSECDWNFRQALLDHGARLPMDAYYEYAVNHPDERNKIMREWLRVQLATFSDANAVTYSTKATTTIAAQWVPDELKKVEEEHIAKLEKKTAKVAKQLDDMGYTTEGKRK